VAVAQVLTAATHQLPVQLTAVALLLQLLRSDQVQATSTLVAVVLVV